MVLAAKDVAESDFLTMKKETNALEGARAMKEKKHGYIVINSSDDRNSRPLGIVTEWDYLSKIVAEGKDPSRVTLEEIMSSGVITVQSGEDIISIAKLMHQKGIRRVLVMEGGNLIGIITSKTVLASLEDYVNRLSAQIARLSSPTF